MGESSVSFGKYENDDGLCLEKWSTFSPNKNNNSNSISNNNKYLEEVGKCSTPGSVAQKKAFFEAHYKKIAAMKLLAEAELLLDQQSRPTQHHKQEDNALESEPPITVTSNGENLQEQEEEEEEPSVTVNSNDELVVLPSQSSSLTTKLEEAALVNNESMNLVKHHFQLGLDLQTQDPPEIIPKSKPQNVIQRLNTNKGVKKKPASVVLPKSPITPASRLSKPKPKETLTSSFLLNKASAPSPSSSSTKNKKPSVSESSRRVSLHLSMSMNSDTASSVISSRRQSLFMEQMGDKDIVKRAFKTFQNRVNRLPLYDTAPKQLPTKRPEQKTWTSMSYQKENGRSRKAVEKINPATCKSGSLKDVGVDSRRQKPGPTLKSNEERRKEFFKKLEERSNARGEAETSLKLKTQEVKEDAEMRKVKQNLNFKAKQETIKRGSTR